MSTEANKRITRRLIEDVLNTGAFALLDELFASTYVNHFPGIPAPLDRAAWEQVITMFRTGFPDLQFTIENQIAEGNDVATWFTVRGTHLGAFQGIAATGKSMTLPCHVLFRLADGKIVEDRPIFDQLSLLQQLGAVPTLGQAMQEAGG